MTKTYALQKLLEHGPLTRRELLEITGWTDRGLHYTLAYCSQAGKIVKDKKAWKLA